MSLLERLGQGHLNDDTFARLWTDGATDPHLERCAECRQRFAAFTQWIGGVAETMRDEADEVLTPERLAAQQAQIARRIEALDRPARVLAFPKAARAVISGHSHVRRWVTVAAAASLIAGFGLGQVVPLRSVMIKQQASKPTPNFSVPVAVDRARELTPAAPTPADDELLSDAFTSPKVKNLSALDDMTPHARDYISPRVRAPK